MRYSLSHVVNNTSVSVTQNIVTDINTQSRFYFVIVSIHRALPLISFVLNKQIIVAPVILLS